MLNKKILQQLIDSIVFFVVDLLLLIFVLINAAIIASRTRPIRDPTLLGNAYIS